MASLNTLYRRMAAEADEERSTRMLFPTTTNRRMRRAAGRTLRLKLKHDRKHPMPPTAADTAHTESEAPT
jgi:hypothetical protein